MSDGVGDSTSEPGKEERTLSEQIDALAHYYSDAESEKRRDALMDRLFGPLEKQNEEFWKEHQRVESQPSRPAVQPERNGSDNFERILDDNPWLK